MDYEKEVARLTAELELEKTKAAQVATLEKNQREQNAYITKLETDLREAKAAQSAQAEEDKQKSKVRNAMLDPSLTQYFERKMREDTIADAMKILINSAGEDTVNLLKPELDEFLSKTMTTSDKVRESYIVDCFHLIYGKALTNKNHAIHKMSQAPKSATPAPNPAPNPFDRRQAPEPKFVPAPPPQMTPRDQNYSTAPPDVENKPKSTKEAMARFKQQIQNGSREGFN